MGETEAWVAVVPWEGCITQIEKNDFLVCKGGCYLSSSKDLPELPLPLVGLAHCRPSLYLMSTQSNPLWQKAMYEVVQVLWALEAATVCSYSNLNPRIPGSSVTLSGDALP